MSSRFSHGSGGAGAAAAAAGAAAGGRAAKRQRAVAARRYSKPSPVAKRGTKAAAKASSIARLSWGRGVFPPTMLTVMSYSEATTLTTTLGACATYGVRMNGMYDPNATGTGGQPRYYDTLLGATDTAAPYGRYEVYAAQLEVVFAQKGPSTVGNTMCFVFPQSSQQSNPTATKELMERPESKVVYATTQQPIKSIKYYTKVAPWVGVYQTSHDVSAPYNSVPSRQAYFVFGVGPLDTAVNVEFICNWTVTYWVKLTSYNDVTDS